MPRACQLPSTVRDPCTARTRSRLHACSGSKTLTTYSKHLGCAQSRLILNTQRTPASAIEPAASRTHSARLPSHHEFHRRARGRWPCASRCQTHLLCSARGGVAAISPTAGESWVLSGDFNLNQTRGPQLPCKVVTVEQHLPLAKHVHILCKESQSPKPGPRLVH